RGLQNHGIIPGMRCVLMVKPSIEFFTLTFALLKIGAVMVCIDPGIGLKNLRTCIAESDAEAFIGISKAHYARKILRWKSPSLKKFFVVGPQSKQWFSMPSYQAIIESGKTEQRNPLHQGSAENPAAILFTSGSTGIPKGVVYSHRNFLRQVDALRILYDIQPGEIDLCTFPLFALFSPALGMSAVIPDMDFTKPGFVNPEKIILPVNNFKVTQMFGSPALLKRVANYGLQNQSKMPSLKRVLSAGAPVHPRVIENFSAMLEDDCQIHTPYGATESLPVASVGSHDILNKHRDQSDSGKGVCVGSPAPGMEIKIIPISDQAILAWDKNLVQSNNNIGEIIVKGDVVTQRYFNRPQSTLLAKIPDGNEFFHRMGDLGYIDDNGLLWFCGRKSHRVESNNELFYSVPCESIFNLHSQVERSALVSLEEENNTIPGICVELSKSSKHTPTQPVQLAQLAQELKALAKTHDHTRAIENFYIHPSFPVDIRHNAKINREKLSRWAQQQRSLPL
ncbi:MAG: AMP-binding protein, partial [Planctomycetes bacterium]|nr:AMP-binding protein [Planctomycetota bacterium]